MPQKVCIRKKWLIFIVYLKWDRILKKKYQGVQQMLNWPSRGHTDLELFSDCQTVFIYPSVDPLLVNISLEQCSFEQCRIFFWTISYTFQGLTV